MKLQNYIIIVIIFLFSCNSQVEKKETSIETKSDKIYQYSLFTALANKIYDGNLTVAGVKEKGDFGLGTFNGLNGEMIVFDGVVYQWLANGTVRLPKDSELVPFTVVTFFDEDIALELPDSGYDELKSFIKSKLSTRNTGFAFKVKADFEKLMCASANKQEKPYTKTLSDALLDRPTFDMEKISGFLVGFWFPEYTGKVNVAGFHFHFISDDKKQAGHVMEFKASNLKISIDYCDGFEIELPETDAFENADFDLSQEYNNNK